MKRISRVLILLIAAALLTCSYPIKPWVVSTIAGSGTVGHMDGAGTQAQFRAPYDVAVDSSGNVYVADKNNHRIRKITPEGMVSTIAGSGTEGFQDHNTGTQAQFDNPYGLAVDSSGNVYVADSGNHLIRKITPERVVSTFAGSRRGFGNGPAGTAQFDNPHGLAVDSSGNVYVADSSNHRIRKITITQTGRDVSTIAGNGRAGSQNDTGTAAQFSFPTDVAVDAAGNVYVADFSNHRIRKITPEGVVSTFAGSRKGFGNGAAGTALFNSPVGVATDSSGNVYITDVDNNRIRKYMSVGVVGTLAGGIKGFSNGVSGSAQFDTPRGVAVDTWGNVYVADSGSHLIRKIAPP